MSSTTAAPEVFFHPDDLVVPGIGTIQGFCASSQARANCAGVTFLFSPKGDGVDEEHVRLARLGTEPWDVIPEVADRTRCSRRSASQKSRTERAERDEPDAKLFQVGRHRVFGFSPPEGILALQGRDRLHGMSFADRIDTRLRRAKMLCLTLDNQLLYSPCNILDRHIGIDAMLVEEVDVVSTKPLQASLGCSFDVVRPAVCTRSAFASFRIDVEAELRRDHNLFADGL